MESKRDPRNSGIIHNELLYRQTSGHPFSRFIANEFAAFLFLLPFLILFGIFYLWPLLRGAWISLYSWGISGMNRFVGLQNYIQLFQEKDFFVYLWHSIYFVLLATPLLIILGLILALIINQKIAGRTFIRSFFFLPYVLSVAVIGFIWLRMFDPKQGLLNVILHIFGFPREINWLTDSHLAWWSIIIASVWWGVGFVMILFLAGLQEISEELYEAASIDGANSFQRFWAITLPGLSRVMSVQIFFQVINNFKIFGQTQIMTHGGPGDTTRTIIQQIYITGFSKNAFGQAAAQSVIFCLFMLLISALQYRFLNKE
ncbi:MAG TPA: sugar ABC transporter permease [Firmicutes bacterium]|jgi:multiple sugar transport system permease protein|nr:sugar ABC transporter permease [Bacillota bacterium]